MPKRPLLVSVEFKFYERMSVQRAQRSGRESE